jgi:hypothetical protein
LLFRRRFLFRHVLLRRFGLFLRLLFRRFLPLGFFARRLHKFDCNGFRLFRREFGQRQAEDQKNGNEHVRADGGRKAPSVPPVRHIESLPHDHGPTWSAAQTKINLRSEWKNPAPRPGFRFHLLATA